MDHGFRINLLNNLVSESVNELRILCTNSDVRVCVYKAWILLWLYSFIIHFMDFNSKCLLKLFLRSKMLGGGEEGNGTYKVEACGQQIRRSLDLMLVVFLILYKLHKMVTLTEKGKFSS